MIAGSRRSQGRRGRVVGASVALFMLIAAAIAAEASEGDAPREIDPAQQQQMECGRPGMPACPLQAWMRLNLGAPLASDDMKALARSLDRAAKLAPDPTWRTWATFAREGAAAARDGDVRKAREACKGCHGAWREAYRARHRGRPIPP